MAKLTYINEKGQSLIFGDSAPFLVTKIEGLGSPKNNIYRHKSPYQDGSTVTHANLDEREIVMEGVILSGDKEAMRRVLIQIFNPKLNGVLIYEKGTTKKKINCKAESAPVFPSNMQQKYQLFTITLLCANPFFYDELELKEEIALWKGDFEFEVEFGEDGIEFGHREPSLIVNVLNNGDVECGMRVEFKALATLTNPSILNVNTGEYIKINKSMVAGEAISVSTYFGNKKVESILNAVTTNAFNYIDFQSVFLQLDTGDNLFRYNADTNLDNLEVLIYYKPQYLGV